MLVVVGSQLSFKMIRNKSISIFLFLFLTIFRDLLHFFVQIKISIWYSIPFALRTSYIAFIAAKSAINEFS